MRCPTNEQWSAYADREAGAAEAERLTAHLSVCESCRLALRSIEAAKRALAAEPAPAMPADLRESLRRSIRETGPAPEERGWGFLSGGWLRPAAALSLAAAALWLALWFKRPAPRPAQSASDPAELLMAAHERFAMTIPLASTEVIVSEESGRLARGPQEGRDVY